MKKVFLVCVTLLVHISHAEAQEMDVKRLEAVLIDYDTSLTVKCPLGSISGYISPYYHVEPRGDGNGGHWSSYDGRYRRHECTRDNAQARRIYLARLEKLFSPDIYRYPLSQEVEKMVYNFEMITGIRNSGGCDLVGWCYISHQTLNGWKVWYNKNKDKLRYCARLHVIYVEDYISK